MVKSKAVQLGEVIVILSHASLPTALIVLIVDPNGITYDPNSVIVIDPVPPADKVYAIARSNT